MRRPRRRGYPLIVRAHLGKLLDRFGDDSIAVFHGEPVDVSAWALRLRKQLTTHTGQAWQDSTGVLTFRRKFEAYTGYDCQTFFDDRGIVQPVDVLAVIDRYLADVERVQMLPGRRYFFERPVPTILEN